MPPKLPHKPSQPKPPRFQLLGASDCQNPSAISKEQILAWQEQGIIEYLGEAKDVRPFVESSSCVVLPSFYKEGVPRVLLEALSMGKPIITTNIAGCKECVAPPFSPYENLLIGQNGILIPPKDPNALSLALSLLISSKLPYTLTQMGENARAFVKARFCISRIIECYKRAVLESMDCHATATALARNDSKLDSSKASFLSSRAFEKGVAIHSLESSFAKMDSSDETMDCHEVVPTSRNDSTAQNLNKQAQDSRILELQIGVFQGSQGDKTSGLSTQRADEIHDFSPKAESTKSAQKPTPKLAFVSNTCFGMHNFRLQVLQSLQKSGFAIHIIAPFDTSTQALEQEGFTTHNLYLDSRALNPIKDFRTAYALYKLLKHIRPALVFNYTIKPAIYSSSVCSFLKIPNIAVITGLGYVFINDRGKTSSLKKRVLRAIVCKMYRFALKSTKEVWFLNNDDKQEFLSHRLITHNQAFLLDSEGVDTEYFSPKSHKVSATTTQDSQGEIVFLLVARMLWDKGVGEFVEAAKMLQESTKALKEANKVDSNGGGHK